MYAFLANAADFLFGYDYFISYSHADGTQYPATLADMLARQNFAVFLDTRFYVVGDELNAATKRRVRMCK